MPRVSIIITTHSRPRLLPRAVESARLACSDAEVVVVDDASTDETAAVCRSLEGIRYVRVERNRGVAGARNVGLFASGCEYITFLDDDDERLPGSLDVQLGRLEAEPQAALIYGQALVVDGREGKGERYYPSACPQGDVFWELLGQNFIPAGSVLFRRSCLLRVGLLDEGVPGLDDWDLWIRMAELFPFIAAELPVYAWRRSTPARGRARPRARAWLGWRCDSSARAGCGSNASRVRREVSAVRRGAHSPGGWRATSFGKPCARGPKATRGRSRRTS
jgi:glycosyltransferase involved in cell wall biosynthesis